jgi:hypothetical protein
MALPVFQTGGVQASYQASFKHRQSHLMARDSSPAASHHHRLKDHAKASAPATTRPTAAHAAVNALHMLGRLDLAAAITLHTAGFQMLSQQQC